MAHVRMVGGRWKAEVRRVIDGGRPAWCAKQLGHSVEVFLTTYAKWIDDGHDSLELDRVEAFIGARVPGESPKSAG